MCGRYSLHSHPNVVALQFGLASVPDFAPRYNIAPAAPILVVSEDGAKIVRWGLIPRWAKDPTIGAKLNNARAETVAEKPAFRDAYRRHRCLIPASGFYEWRRDGSMKQPFYFRPTRGELLAIAGLWEAWDGPQGAVETCAVVTTEANEVMRPIHDRMPVLIAPQDHGKWLRGAAAELLRPPPGDSVVAYPVSTAVNHAANDSAGLIEPVLLAESKGSIGQLFGD